MSFRSDFDVDAFMRELNLAVRERASKGMDEIGGQLQALLDDLEPTRGDKSQGEIEQELRRRAKGEGFNLSDEHLQTYAGAIAEGRHIKVVVDKSSLDELR